MRGSAPANPLPIQQLMRMLRWPSPKTFQQFPTRVRLSFLCFALNYSSYAPLVSSDT